MIRFVVAKFFPDRAGDSYVNIGIVAQDGENLIAKFCSNHNDLAACPNTDIKKIPLHIGRVFEENLSSPPRLFDYSTMKDKTLNFASIEYLEYINKNSFRSQLRYSEVFSLDLPVDLSDWVVDLLYKYFVIKQTYNPNSTTEWQKSSKKVGSQRINQAKVI